MFNRISLLSVVMAGSLVFSAAGCAEDNEAAVKNQAEANAKTDKTTEAAAPAITSQVESAKPADSYTKQAGYPEPTTAAAPAAAPKTEGAAAPKTEDAAAPKTDAPAAPKTDAPAAPK